MACGLAVLACAGCASRIAEVPGTGPAGPVGTAARGGGSLQDSGAMDDIRILPPADSPRPSIPQMRQGRTAQVWFYENVSRDRLTVRQGFWATRALEGYRWYLDIQEDQNVPLEQGSAGGTDPTDIAVPDRQVIEPQDSFMESFSNLGKGMSWSAQPDRPAQPQAPTAPTEPAP